MGLLGLVVGAPPVFKKSGGLLSSLGIVIKEVK
jgi:hypothetical protein